MHPTSPELVDVAEAAQILHMSPGAVRKAAERGQIPCSRIGRLLRDTLSGQREVSGTDHRSLGWDDLIGLHLR